MEDVCCSGANCRRGVGAPLLAGPRIEPLAQARQRIRFGAELVQAAQQWNDGHARAETAQELRGATRRVSSAYTRGAHAHEHARACVQHANLFVMGGQGARARRRHARKVRKAAQPLRQRAVGHFGGLRHALSAPRAPPFCALQAGAHVANQCGEHGDPEGAQRPEILLQPLRWWIEHFEAVAQHRPAPQLGAERKGDVERA
jgi:hypothetical protein